MSTLFNIGNKIVSSDIQVSAASFSPSVYLKSLQGQETGGSSGQLSLFFPENDSFTVQRENGAGITGSKYLIDIDNNLSEISENVPSFEYNSDNTSRGLLVESSSKNEIRNSTCVGAIAGEVGNVGQLPNFWSESLTSLTNEIIESGTENGIEYVDIRFYGTATSQGSASPGTNISHQIFLESNKIAVPPYDPEEPEDSVWTNSLYAKVIDETLPPNEYLCTIYAYDSSNTFLDFKTSSFEPTKSLQRYSVTFELNQDVAFVQPIIRFRVIEGEQYNFTLRIGLPQMENRPFPSSPIKTTNSSLTRNRDRIFKENSEILIGQSEGTIYAKVNFISLVGFKYNGYILQLYNLSNPSDFRIFLSKFSNNISFGFENNDVPITMPAKPTQLGIHKLAFVYKQNERRTYLDGEQLSISTLDWGNFESTNLNSISIGSAAFNNSEFNQPIEEIAIYKRPLSEEEAIKLTTL